MNGLMVYFKELTVMKFKRVEIQGFKSYLDKIDGTFDFEAATFPTGAYTFSNGNGTLASIAYDATGSADCKIIYIS